MTTPIFNLGQFTVCFDAEPEYISARHHFIKECGWTESQFRSIKDYPFFCARVSIWLDGVELASDYLGACSYKTEAEFYTRYRSDYFADMVSQCVSEANNPELTEAHKPWAELMRKEHAKKSAIAQKAWEKREAKKAAANV
jgi:hypothetical protein